MNTSVTIASRMHFELADLRLLSIEDAKATLPQFEWLQEFLIHSHGPATAQESAVLPQRIEALSRIIQG